MVIGLLLLFAPHYSTSLFTAQPNGRRDGFNPSTSRTMASSSGRRASSMEMKKRTKVGSSCSSLRKVCLCGEKLLLFSTPGMQTSENAKFYARTASFDQVSNEGKTLVVQFTVKHEQKMDCGGGYLKVGGVTLITG